MATFRTKKRFTLVSECCDPALPVDVVNTNSLVRAKFVFNEWKQEEISEGGGGEFSLVFFEHTGDSGQNPATMACKDDPDSAAFVYNVDYPSSIRRDSFSYMDLYHME